ncbi:hydroxysqualene dehydroxylase HpnE [Rhodoferax sp. PAMC 29310]|uniref:hydroxysqualene dehydroxylase HpnE n=1 Tax=Rhodoferax sp. PAMC 29310 TaxID=2822760 RepID=UPI001B33829F|nr:hydroxysqualene dehydroxylase HpnE [Rhodoferax sp. PAMC 29310]
MKIAIIGAGWAGMAAAVQVTKSGHTAIVFEAARAIGGRARALDTSLPDGTEVTLDNGQHILIGAYADTLKLMAEVGVREQDTLRRTPMALLFPDGKGLRFPNWPTPLDALGGIVTAKGWTWADKGSLLRVATAWQFSRFLCPPTLSVAALCAGLTPRVMTELIEPLCVSALNTPAHRASAQVFLRVMKDALFGVQGGSHLLLPKQDLTALFPGPAASWLAQRGGQVQLGVRVEQLTPSGAQWLVNDQRFDAVILATSSAHAARLLENTAQAAPAPLITQLQDWIAVTAALQFEAIATVYAWAPQASLSHPMVSLPPSHDAEHPAPAQFVFDRGQLGGPKGLLAFVVSASEGDRETLQTQVIQQAKTQLGLSLQAVTAVVDKRATFACTPGLQRPVMKVAPGLLACGDYVKGPYPATLEGAVRSGLAAANAALA